MKKKVVIIGGGFAGVSALRWLSWYRKEFDITLIDRKCHFEFLPLLPDTISNRVNPHSLACPLPSLVGHFGARFVNAGVSSVDFTSRAVMAGEESIPYDFAVIAAGAETNYFDYADNRHLVYPINTVDDAIRIRVRLVEKAFKSYIIVGGGYTGVETATNLRRFLNMAGESDSRVVILERQKDILGPLPEWMKEYVRETLVAMGIGVITDATVTSMDRDQVTLSSGEVFADHMVFWSAGVKAPAFIGELEAKKGPQGRLVVDRFLRVNETCYAAGDAAAYSPGQTPLRMAVQFAVSQGESAAANIVASVRGQPLKHYRFLDLGFVVPMANNTACGNVLGIEMKGFFPLALHYLLCIYRSCGMRNKMRVLKNVCWDPLWVNE